MLVGSKVKVFPEEPEYCDKAFHIGTVEKEIKPYEYSVRFEDGEIRYFHLSELKIESEEK